MGGAELGYIEQAFASNYIAPLGPMVDAFEREFAAYTGIPHCLALSSGTAAMHLALRELGVGPGDEVLASTLTFIGSVTPVTFLGGQLRFIDSDAETWNMDPELLAQELADCARRGQLPSAVVPTDLYGQCANMPQIMEICRGYEVPVVADAAEAMGSRYGEETQDGGQWTVDGGRRGAGEDVVSATSNAERPNFKAGLARPNAVQRHAGYGADAAVFSFNGNKIITTSGGGMLASHNQELIEHARKLSQQAREPAPHYEHVEIGYNYRMSNVLAAIGRGQLQVLEERVRKKRQIFDWYQKRLGGLPGIAFMPEWTYGQANRWLTVVTIDPQGFGATNEQVRLALEEENIESRPVWKPMHLQPVFRDCPIRGGAVSERLFEQGLCLPSGTAMTEDDVERVVGTMRRCAGLPVRRQRLDANPSSKPALNRETGL